MNKIGIIGVRGLPAKHGAFDSFLQQFISSDDLKTKDIKFYVSCDRDFRKYNFKQNKVTRIFVYRGKGFYILIHYFLSILRMFFSGVRTFLFFGYGAAIFFPILKVLNCKIICNPDGIEWKRPGGKIKKLFFKLCENLFSKCQIDRIFDSKVIKKYYKINYGVDGKVIYYPSGFENNPLKIKKKKIFERFYILGRLLEENNTELIIKAFAKSEGNKKLYVIGKSNNYFNKKIKPLIDSKKNIIFLGAIYDRQKLFNICTCCDYYIHGHSVGGTNPTLIEAINIKKKILSFKTSFNREILSDNAMYFKNESDLLKILNFNKYKSLQIPYYKKEFTAKYINSAYLSILLDT